MISALLIGIAGSLHCIGMCAPLQMAFIPKSNFLNYLLYHFARIVSYGFLGLIAGLFIEAIDLFPIQQYISIISGLIIILFVFFQKVQNYFEKIFSNTIIYKRIINQYSKLSKKEGQLVLFFKGFLNGLLPCGLVYVALLASLNESHLWYSSLYMMMFGLGTIPLLLFSNILLKKIKFNNMSIIRNLLISIVGILFILRGLGLGIPYLSPSIHSHSNTELEVSCH